MTPMPPACAMAIAMRLSVTVSIAEERIGRLSAMSLVTRVLMSTSVGNTSERAGCSSTSSKVSALSPVMEEMIFAKGGPFPSEQQKNGSPQRTTRGPAAGWRG